MDGALEQNSEQGSQRSKRRRVARRNISELWNDFYQACLRLKPPYSPMVDSLDVDSEMRRCKVYCPYGEKCGHFEQPLCFENMLFMEVTGDVDRRKVLDHVRNKHPHIAAMFDVEKKGEGHDEHQRIPEDAATVQFDGQVSTPLLCSDRDDDITGLSSEDAEEASQSSDECSVCTEVRRRMPCFLIPSYNLLKSECCLPAGP